MGRTVKKLHQLRQIKISVKHYVCLFATLPPNLSNNIQPYCLNKIIWARRVQCRLDHLLSLLSARSAFLKYTWCILLQHTKEAQRAQNCRAQKEGVLMMRGRAENERERERETLLEIKQDTRQSLPAVQHGE